MFFRSFNHCVYGAPAGGLSFAKGSYTSTYGKIGVEWKETEAGYEYRFEIPANTTATLILPRAENAYLIDGKLAEDADGVTILEQDGEKVKYELVSGTYCFILDSNN